MDSNEETFEFLKLTPKERLFIKRDIQSGREAEFIALVETGNVKEVEEWLQAEMVDVNCKVEVEGIQVTPLLIAAEKNDFQMVHCLLNKGAERVMEPKKNTAYDEDITVGLLRLKEYGAISSPAYICFTSENPLLSAFHFSRLLRCMSTSSGIHMIYSEDYLKLVDRADDFTVALLELCKNKETVSSLLKDCCKSKTKWWNKEDWKTLREAFDKKQKKFVADSKTQHVIQSAWIDGQPFWAENSGICWKLIYAIFLLIMCGALQPILALSHIFIPCSPVSRFIKSPKTKFTMRMISYATFFCLLIIKEALISQHVHVFSPQGERIIIVLLYIWTMGFLLGEVQQAFCQGAWQYCCDLWNVLDITVLLLIFASIVLQSIGHEVVAGNPYFAVTSLLVTLALLRGMQFFYLHEKLGSMLLSFTSMAGDVFAFICLFLIVVFSFAMSFHVLHHYYYSEDGGKTALSTFRTGIATLLWTIFGKDATDQMDVYDLRYTNFTDGSNTSNTSVPVFTLEKSHLVITTTTSYILYCVFCFLTLLILLNLCIAMMSDTFTKIQDNIDIEWKFERSKIWMDFIAGPVLASPFNIVPTYEFLRSCVKWIKGGPSEMPCIYEKQLVRMLTLHYINKHMLGQKEYVCSSEDSDHRISGVTTESNV
ncbi:short transient receptor potential channel 4-like isoform X1 [Ptychodera flava]|uniref:short transient receptor potential channel 4-like isoform X1 n=2 Tax=Ptychodera flava TaxID=63121 RepID=UPI00396A96D1